MSDLRMKPGDTLTILGETWTHRELLDQLAVERCDGFMHRHFALPPLQRAELRQIAMVVKGLPRPIRGRELDALAAVYGISRRTIDRYLKAA